MYYQCRKEQHIYCETYITCGHWKEIMDSQKKQPMSSAERKSRQRNKDLAAMNEDQLKSSGQVIAREGAS